MLLLNTIYTTVILREEYSPLSTFAKNNTVMLIKTSYFCADKHRCKLLTIIYTLVISWVKLFRLRLLLRFEWFPQLLFLFFDKTFSNAAIIVSGLSTAFLFIFSLSCFDSSSELSSLLLDGLSSLFQNLESRVFAGVLWEVLLEEFGWDLDEIGVSGAGGLVDRFDTSTPKWFWPAGTSTLVISLLVSDFSAFSGVSSTRAKILRVWSRKVFPFKLLTNFTQRLGWRLWINMLRLLPRSESF